MHRIIWFILCLAVSVPIANAAGRGSRPSLPGAEKAFRILDELRYSADGSAIFRVSLVESNGQFILAGFLGDEKSHVELTNQLTRAGVDFHDSIQWVPSRELGAETWGIGCLSVTSGREEPAHKAEMGTQLQMGEIFRVLKKDPQGWMNWYLVQCPDGYVAWAEEGTFTRCDLDRVRSWTNSSRMKVTVAEDLILDRPAANGAPVGDVVMGNIVNRTGPVSDWVPIELADGRRGFIKASGLQELSTWHASRKPLPANIENTAKMLLGRPYLWGGVSPKGFDCSGFTQHVFRMNGIGLLRNSSQQARQGTDVPLDHNLSRLQPGDLLFFGRKLPEAGRERVVHVGIYLGDKLFIHSSEMVRINSLDPASPIRDEQRIRTLLRARRVLPEVAEHDLLDSAKRN